MKRIFFGLIFIGSINTVAAQSTKFPRYMGNPIPTDSLGNSIVTDGSTSLIISIMYNEDMLSDNKLALWNDYYANIIFYDFKTDSSRRLFSSDTFIKRFSGDNPYSFPNAIAQKNDNISRDWIFYFVKAADYDDNGRVDGNDPFILYASDKHGHNLKAITPANENAISIKIFEKQGFAFIKMQRDFNQDRNFKYNDHDFYYCKIDLKTLALGNKIELNDTIVNARKK